MPDYDAIFRKLHPRSSPFSPWERQRELRDLWPADQQKFKGMVDTVLAEGKRTTRLPDLPEFSRTQPWV